MTVFGVENVKMKSIPGYGGAYVVGSDGTVWRGGSEIKAVKGYVNLSWKGRVDKVKVCYLVARAFLPNMEGRPYVNHKDGDTGNNSAGNLEWSETRERTQGKKKVEWGPVTVWRKADGTLVGSWNRLEEACVALGVDERSVKRQIHGGAKSVKGYIFKV